MSDERVLKRLGNLSLERFMSEHFQRQALFLPDTLAGFESPLTPEELAGLALEPDVESRLVTHSPEAPWQLRQGPFTEQDFTGLPERDWTLLVQAVDHHVPAVAELLDRFRFIPNWRLDDVMVSYAPTGGSVGPHFDYYDVFLVQGAGRRQWQLGQRCGPDCALRRDTDLSILAEFECHQSVEAGPGDIVYIPPGVAHWGTALTDDCVTYSIGFRAPSHAEILRELGDHLAAGTRENERYRDPAPLPTDNPGRIDPAAIGELRRLINAHLTDERLADWFARTMTEPKTPPETDEPAPSVSESELAALVEQNPPLWRESASRFAYLDGENQAQLYVDGERFYTSPQLARQLCNQSRWLLAELAQTARSDADRAVIRTLIGREWLWVDDD